MLFVSLTPGGPDIAAFPDSVNVLGGVAKDVRTPDKLIDGYHDTTEGAHMWLAPILPDTVSHTHNDHMISLLASKVNRVYIIFDTTVTLGAVKLWNYAKTPTRGVRELSVWTVLLLPLYCVTSSVPHTPRY